MPPEYYEGQSKPATNGAPATVQPTTHPVANGGPAPALDENKPYLLAQLAKLQQEQPNSPASKNLRSFDSNTSAGDRSVTTVGVTDDEGDTSTTDQEKMSTGAKQHEEKKKDEGKDSSDED